MPNGLTITTRSYTDEAGEAELVEERLTPATRALLKKEIAGGEPLAKYVARWQTAARELGKVEQQRIDLAAAPAVETTAKTPGAARNTWIRVMNAIVDMLELEKSMSQKDRRKLRDPLEDAQKKAARRGAGRVADEAGDAPLDEEPVDESAEEPAPAKLDAAKKKPEPVE
jgi:hypothetical protein